jgi:hypothetical protein
LGKEDWEKKLIKPKKQNNKIFVVSKDIPNENKVEFEKPINDNNKQYIKSEKQCKTSKNLNVYKIKESTDPKIHRTKIIKREVHFNRNDCSVGGEVNVKKNLYTSLNSDKHLNYLLNNDLRNKSRDNHRIKTSYHHSKENYKRNYMLNSDNKVINNNINTKIYCSSFINTMPEENKTNNINYVKYDNRPKNSFLSGKNVTSFYSMKNTIPINPDKYRNRENLSKQTKDKVHCYSKGKTVYTQCYNLNTKSSKELNKWKFNTLTIENDNVNDRIKKYKIKINTNKFIKTENN